MPIYSASVTVSVSLNLLHHSDDIDRGTSGEATPDGRDRLPSQISSQDRAGREILMDGCVELMVPHPKTVTWLSD